MLKSFFGSKTRVKLLGLFLLHPKNEYFIRELTRKLQEQINSIRRELDNLKKVGLLKVSSRNRKKYYSINKNFALLDEFKSIFVKTVDPQSEIVKAISQFGVPEFLLLTGQFVDGSKAEIDMLAVGDLDKDGLREYLDKELTAKQKIKFTVFTRDDFLYRLDCKDKFILDLINSQDKSVPVNKLKKYIDARARQ